MYVQSGSSTRPKQGPHKRELCWWWRGPLPVPSVFTEASGAPGDFRPLCLILHHMHSPTFQANELCTSGHPRQSKKWLWEMEVLRWALLLNRRTWLLRLEYFTGENNTHTHTHAHTPHCRLMGLLAPNLTEKGWSKSHEGKGYKKPRVSRKLNIQGN